MKVDLKSILRNVPPGDRAIIFWKLDTCSRGLKDNIPGADSGIWELAYNLRRFSENLPNRRYIGYDDQPKHSKLDEGLLPYIKVVRVYARLPDAKKQEFQEEVNRPSKPLKQIYLLRYNNTKQKG